MNTHFTTTRPIKLWVGLGLIGLSVVLMFSRPNQRPRDADRDLLSAACVGDVAAVDRALGMGADINQKETAIPWHVPPLHVAVMMGQVDAVKELLRRGADVNARSTDGETALMCVVDCPNPIEMRRILIEAGARQD